MSDGIPWWLQAIYLALIPATVAMVVATIQQRQARKAAAPRDEAERDALETRVQGETLDRIAAENQRMTDRMEALEKRADAAQKKADEAQSAADTAKALSREQGIRLAELERKQALAIRTIGDLITAWPTAPVPTIPADLAADVDPHIKRPREH